MKIYFRGKSKNKITYQPKRLFIEVKGKEQEYALLGTNSGGYDHIADDFKAVLDGNLYNYYEIFRSGFSCIIAALSSTYAIWLFYPRQVYCYGGVWLYGISVLQTKEGSANMDICDIGAIIPAFGKNSIRTYSLEYR